MSVDILKLKTLAEAAKRDQYDCLALNDYGMAVPPAVVLELITEIERHRQVEAEGCKPESSILHPGVPCAGVAARRGLDNVEGCKPDVYTCDESASDLRRALPVSEALTSLTAAARDVLAERQRQIEVEGYSPEQDDKYARGELADAGSVYAFWASTPNPQATQITPPCWPWAPEHWKPTNQRNMLIKAGALILAELERLERMHAREVRHD